MAKYKSPWSVGQRKTVFIDANDPRVNTSKDLEKTRANMGRDVEIVTSNQPISIEEYEFNQYWFDSMYKVSNAKDSGYVTSSNAYGKNLYGVGPSGRYNDYNTTTYPLTGILSIYDKLKVILTQKKFYITDLSKSIIPEQINIDLSGNYITSGRIGTASYNSFTNTKGYIAKHSSDMSSIVWSKDIVPPVGDTIGTAKSAVDKDGNVYVYGLRSHPDTYSGINYTHNVAYIIKYDTNGVIQWQKTIKSYYWIADAIPTDFAFDSDGYIYILSYANYVYAPSPILTKINPLDGSVIWTKYYTGYGETNYSRSMIIDSNNNIYITAVVSASPNNGVVLIQVDTNGSVIWSKKIISNAVYTNIALDLALDSQQNLYFLSETGSYGGAHIIKLDVAGDIKWIRFLDSNSVASNLFNISINSDNDIYLTGRGGGAGSQGSELFSGKIPSDGSLTGNYIIPAATTADTYTISYISTTLNISSYTANTTNITNTISNDTSTSTSISLSVSDLTYSQRGIFIA